MTQRIVLIGPECTGKTTMAGALANHYRAPWIPEAARSYAGEIGRALTAADVEVIAARTIDAHEAALALRPPLLVFDTDLISTVVYARHYYGACPTWIERAARERRSDLYLLCSPDLPWTADGVRDRPERRDELFGAFENALTEFSCANVTISGTGAARDEAARDAAAALIAAGELRESGMRQT